MAVATFDGPNLRIILPSAQSNVDVESEIYSAWKQWALLADNSKFPPAFRSTGGDPLTPGIEAGAYFFIQNQFGWRIRPAEEDATVFLAGNLAPEDSTLDILVPTLGNFRVLVVNLQPITQNVDTILTQAQDAEYQGVVSIDTMNGTAGTTYPVGTQTTPVDNLADAITIATNLGIRTFDIRGVITLTQAFTDWTFRGIGADFEDTVNLNGQNVSGSSFEDLTISGTMTVPTAPVEVFRGFVNNVTNFQGTLQQVGFEDDLFLAPGQTNAVACYSAAPGVQKVIFDLQSNAVDLFIRGWNGVFQVSNGTNASSLVSIDLVSGRVTLNASNTMGTYNLRGVGSFTNNLPGTATFNKVAFVDGLDVKLIKALDAGNVTITGSNPFVVEVLDPDDNVTPIARFDVSADGRTRTRTL